MIAFLAITFFLQQAPGQEDPRTRFNAAVDMAKAGQVDEAMAIWLAVLPEIEAEHRPSVHRALGLAYAQQGKLPEAWHHLTLFVQVKEEGKATKTRARLQEVQSALIETHRKVTIACDPKEAQVYLGTGPDGPAYSSPLTWWFPPGRHFVYVTANGYSPRTEPVDVSDQCIETLRTVILAPLVPAADGTLEPLDASEVERQFELAARTGQVALLSDLARRHGALIKGLACAKAWTPAVRAFDNLDCRPDVFRILLDVGVQACIDSTLLAQALDRGCVELVDLLLPLMSPAEIATATSAMVTSRFEESPPEEAERMLSLLTRLRAFLADACAAKAPGEVCESVGKLDLRTEQWFASMARRNSAENLRGFFANHAALARKHNCAMTRRLVSDMTSDSDCQRIFDKLAGFYQHGDSLCPMADLFEYVCRHRCEPLARLLVPDLPEQELARASMWYNDGNRYQASDAQDSSVVSFDKAMDLGRYLVEANRKLCLPQNPDSASCKAAAHVEKQMQVTQERMDYLRSPEFIFGESCDLLAQVAQIDQDVAQFKRLARESGSNAHADSIRVYLTNKDRLLKWLDLNKARYRKASGKRFNPKDCPK